MPKSHFHCILGFLALFGALYGSKTPTAPACNTQAWVRAPDLTPNAIVHGDARVKISAECPDIDNVLLGLRLKERSFIKALRSREDVKLLNYKPPKNLVITDFSRMSPWARVSSRRPNRSVEDAYEELLMNKDLWVVKEEERVVFETTNPISMGNRIHGTPRDTVHNFSILIPSTNLPPIFNPFSGGFSMKAGDGEIVDAEWMYEYFAQIHFANGTTKEISAGFTAFQPQPDPSYAPYVLPSAIVELKLPSNNMNRDLVKNTPTANYSIEISADSGLTFVAGIFGNLSSSHSVDRAAQGSKNHVVTAVVIRTGPARAFSAPLNISACVMQEVTSKWAVEHGISDANAGFITGLRSVLCATSDGSEQTSHMQRTRRSCRRDHKISVIMPNSTSDEIQANETVTTSVMFTIAVDMNVEHVPTFETYYQTISNSLKITLKTPCVDGEYVDPDEPYGQPDSHLAPTFEDDEEAWVPWETKSKWHRKTWKSYSGHIPVVVHPSREGTLSRHCSYAPMDTSGQVVLSDETGCEHSPSTHYLTEGARGPTFIDRNTLPELLAEDPVERQLRTPILKPLVSSPPKGEEAISRYYHSIINSKKRAIYVGETWAKKVAHKNEIRSVM